MDLFHFDDDFRSFRRKEKAKKRSCLFINIYSCLNDICVKLNRELFDWELLVRYFFFFFFTQGGVETCVTKCWNIGSSSFNL